ncbi:hypothetical protein [Streptomyces cucumeris]|uniref:hypothetical protein n=1 Tax=Streptomyces cucumeris TaxID=2962890 RepID=UPI003D7080D9
MTVQRPTATGVSVATWHGDVTAQPGSTRRDLYEWLRAEHGRRYPDTVGGIVLFFSLEPNQL